MSHAPEPVPLARSVERLPQSHTDGQAAIGEVVRGVVKRWPIVIVGTCLFALTGFVVASLRQPTYEATSVLIVTPPKVRATDPPRVISLPALIASDTVADQAVKKLGLDRPSEDLTAQTFLTKALIVEEVRGTPMLRVTVRLNDPGLAAQTANLVAGAGVELSRRINQEESVSVRDYIKSQLDEARVTVGQVRERFLAFKRDAQVELLQADTSAMLDQRQELLDLVAEIGSERARLQRTEEELKKQDQILTVKRSPETTAALPEAATVGENEEQRKATGLYSSQQVLNPVYEMLQYQVTTTRSNIAALEQRRQELAATKRLDAAKFEKLSQLYEKETELQALQDEYELARKLYLDLTTRYEEARVQVVTQTPQLHILDRAVPPSDPRDSRRLFTITIATIAGFLISISVAFLMTCFGPRPRRD